MNNRNSVAQVFYFFIYIALQILILRNLVLFNVSFCYIYVAFLLLIPFEINAVLYMLLGFFTGFITDLFYDTVGIHTAACVLITYLRPKLVPIIQPRGGYDTSTQPLLRDMGFEWFLLYSSIFVLIHHFTIFYLEAAGFTNFFFTLAKVIMSSLFTVTVMVLIQLLFYYRGRSNV